MSPKRELALIELLKNSPAHSRRDWPHLTKQETLSIACIGTDDELTFLRDLLQLKEPFLLVQPGQLFQTDSQNWNLELWKDGLSESIHGKSLQADKTITLLEGRSLGVKTLVEAYKDTILVFYSKPFAEPAPAFHSMSSQRTIWIPAVGWHGSNWLDGPLVVCEGDGTISSYVPTGQCASLLLAPDAPSPAKGRDLEAVKSLDGSFASRCFRSVQAATERTLLQNLEQQDSDDKVFCVDLEEAASFSDLEAAVYLYLVRCTLPDDTALHVCFSKSPHLLTPKDLSPGLRRFFEHAGLIVASGEAPDIGLKDIFSWINGRWTAELAHHINTHGNIIPDHLLR